MQFLLHGTVTPAAAEALRARGHATHASDELDLAPDAPLIDILEAAHQRQWDIVTTEQDLVQASYEHDFWFGRSILFLQLSGGDVEQDDAIDRLFDRYKRLTPKRLYTITETRVKIRQLPGPA